MIGIVDAIIILVLIMGLIIGYKRGVIKSATMFLGTAFVLILAFFIKNPVSKIMYTYLPFFNFKGVFSGVEVFNILLYEAIAFLLVYIILMALLHILIRVSSILEKILKYTIVLGIPSKILGGIFGFFEHYLFIFLALFILSRFNVMTPFIEESKLGQKIMSSSPIISKITNDYYQSFSEIYSLKEKYEETTNKDEYNKEALQILLKYRIITVDSAKNLINKGKLKTPNIIDVVDEYEKGEKTND